MSAKNRGVWAKTVPSEPNCYNWGGKPIIQAGQRKLDPSRPVAIDLFSGCGGISAGFSSAGMQTILAVDIHSPSIKTFRHNHPESSTILGDISKISRSAVSEILAGNRIDVIAGGAPCQGFSRCNRKQNDADERNQLFREYMKFVKWLQPKFVFFENVQSIRSAADGSYALEIERCFESLGYRVTSGPVNAVDFAVPQKRIRWIFFGIRQSRALPPWPIGDRRGLAPLTVYDAIGDLPRVEQGQSAVMYDRDCDRPYQSEMRSGSTELLNHAAPKHPQETAARIAMTLPGAPMYQSFKQRIRLSFDQPSPTQVSGGIRPQFQFGHPSLARGLTIRERCRIQSFPDRYPIHGGLVQGRVQTGNAVPPRVAEGFARLILSIMTSEQRIAFEKRHEQLRFDALATA